MEGTLRANIFEFNTLSDETTKENIKKADTKKDLKAINVLFKVQFQRTNFQFSKLTGLTSIYRKNMATHLPPLVLLRKIFKYPIPYSLL